eukprot:4111828-Pleurochrysis_carterae.AAC.1
MWRRPIPALRAFAVGVGVRRRQRGASLLLPRLSRAQRRADNAAHEIRPRAAVHVKKQRRSKCHACIIPEIEVGRGSHGKWLLSRKSQRIQAGTTFGGVAGARCESWV